MRSRRQARRCASAERFMTEGMLQQALAYASRGWPVFPCQPGQKIPATRHGYRDATTDQERITAWFSLLPPWNLAIATGTPGPDVLDVDQHGPAGNGFAALERLRRAGLAGRCQYLRAHPERRPSPLLRRLRPTQWAPARSARGLQVRRRLHRRPALPGERQTLPAPQDARRPRRPGLGHGHGVAATTAATGQAGIPPGHGR